MARLDWPPKQPQQPRWSRRDTLGAMVMVAAIIALVVGATLYQSAEDQAYADAAAAEAVQEAGRQARLQAWYQSFFDQASSPEDTLEFCRQRMYDQLPFAAPAQVLAITPQRVDAIST